MVIGIYDPWEERLRESGRWAQELGMEIGEPVQAFCFSREEDLLGYRGEALELLFLSLTPHLEPRQALALGAAVNRQFPQCPVAYVAESLEYASDVYHTRHIHYLLRRELRQRMGEAVGFALRLRSQGQSCRFSLKGGGELRLAPEDIRYFERDKRTTLLYTPWGCYRLKDKLEDIRGSLPQVPLARCHNSYLVHLSAIRALSRTQAVLTDGSVIPISRGSREAVGLAWSGWKKIF